MLDESKKHKIAEEMVAIPYYYDKLVKFHDEWCRDNIYSAWVAKVDKLAEEYLSKKGNRNKYARRAK